MVAGVEPPGAAFAGLGELDSPVDFPAEDPPESAVLEPLSLDVVSPALLGEDPDAPDSDFLADFELSRLSFL